MSPADRRRTVLAVRYSLGEPRVSERRVCAVLDQYRSSQRYDPARRIGLPPEIHLHSLRATFACHLIEKGVDIYTISRLLGHSSVKVTEKHYLALNQEHVRTAVNHLDFVSDV